MLRLVLGLISVMCVGTKKKRKQKRTIQKINLYEKGIISQIKQLNLAHS